jgi:hypothetical protein
MPDSSWDAVHKWSKKWLPTVGISVGVLAAMFGAIKYIVSSEVSGMASDITTIKSTLQPIPDEIRSLENRMTKMETHWEDLKLKNLSQVPPSKESVEAIRQVLDEAQRTNVRLSTDTVENLGAGFLRVADKNPLAWDAAKAFLDYRSSLNVDALPLALTPSTGTSKYREAVTIIPNPEHPELHKAFSVSFAGGHVPSDISARLEKLDKPQPEGSEFAFYVIDGSFDTIVLDGSYMKHVVIRNADVEYDGGAVRLEDVYFVNCAFHSRFKASPKTIALSRQLLASAAINFPPSSDIS